MTSVDCSSQLTDSETAIRCWINFDRLLHKTFILLDNNTNTQNICKIMAYYKALLNEFEILKDFQHNTNITNIDFHELPNYQKQLQFILKYILESIQENKTQNKNEQKKEENIALIENEYEMKSNDTFDFETEKEMKLHFHHPRKRRVMRFSEKLQLQMNEKRNAKLQNMNEENDGSLESEISKRERMSDEILSMTMLLKDRAKNISQTIVNDKLLRDTLEEKTFTNLENVQILNNRMRKYMENNGCKCQLCIMMVIVIASFIFTFFLIYFI